MLLVPCIPAAALQYLFWKTVFSFIGDLKFLRSADFPAAMGRMGQWRDEGDLEAPAFSTLPGLVLMHRD
jgi:hypothetical protein